MKKIKENFTIRNYIYKPHYNQKLLNKDLKKTSNFLSETYSQINKKKDFFYLLSKQFKFNFKEKDLIKYKKFNSIVVIGMGGSILGSNSIYTFLKHKIKKEFLFLDNLNENQLDKIIRKNLKKKLFIIISKSGNTIETLVNTILLKNVKLNSNNTIIITENKKSSLYIFSKKIKALTIEHKKYVGGRYSVLSEVGMLPANLMGLKTEEFRKNLLDYFKIKSKNFFLTESSAKISQIYLNNKIRSIIFLNYCPQLKDFLLWCQQLIAESLGKRGMGLLPVISSAPKDHHSLLQLYLDGPRDKIFYLFSSKSLYNFKIENSNLDKSSNFINNKKVEKIILAQKNSLIKILKRKNIPFREFCINKFNEDVIAELFTYFSLETTAIAKLINVNAFTQPAVEEVKVLTKKFLT